MISTEELEEIQNRNFLSKTDYFQKYNNVKSIKKYGDYHNIETLVSIVMPIYNHPLQCFERALRSAIEQENFDDYRIIVVDNDSNGMNNNESIVKKLNSSKVEYYRNEKNLGMFGNWNRGISLAKSKWISFLHSDDILRSKSLETMWTVIKEHPEIDQLACNYTIYDADEFDYAKIDDIRKDEKKSPKVARSISVDEYLDRMVTSVKGAWIKKEKMLEIGGFRDMNQGLGVSDYTTMLKYVYYYDVYLLDNDLYLNGWGQNETLNSSHWYPELVANYYMQRFFAKKKNKYVAFFNECRYINSMLYRAGTYNSGKNFTNKVIEVDTNQLLKDCSIDKIHSRVFYGTISKLLSAYKIIVRKIVQKNITVK